ncbi:MULTISPECIES: hypothetical protein [unclassified Serratia (in: enterobacteria)]|uniref:hypothetical protein n=1 Tax=unclassified Serratia (in: enterobacteria) TaxID=2647522 RepID=UPI003B4287D7
MIHEKVLFSYPTLIREGMIANGQYLPDAMMYGIVLNKCHTIVITAGFITAIDKLGLYWNEIDIKLNDVSILSPSNQQKGSANILLAHPASKTQQIAIVSFRLREIRLTSSDLYTVVVSLHGSDSDGNKGNLLDTKECGFFVVGEDDNG